MIALIALALAQDPAPAGIQAPTTVGRAALIEPIPHLMPERTKKLVALPGTALLEWDGMGEVAIGDYVDLWTKSPRGVCLAAPRLMVVLGPNGENDAKHGVPVLRVPTADLERLRELKYAAWTPRKADDPRDYAELACR